MKLPQTGKLEKRSYDYLRIIKCGDLRVFVVDSYRKDLISAISDKFGADAENIPPRAASARLEELSRQLQWKAKAWQARSPA